MSEAPSRLSGKERGRRLVAFLLDVSPLLVLLLASVFFIGSSASPTQAFEHGMLASGILLIALLIWIGVDVVMHVRRGASPGKRLLGLEVVRLDGDHMGYGTALAREGMWKIGAVVLCGLAGPLGVGIAVVALWAPALIRADGRGLHDLALQTIVRRTT